MDVPDPKARQSTSRQAAIAAALLIGYFIVGLCANICFKQGGTDPSRQLTYFIIGNAFGISSTALLMGVYARMQVNLAMVLASSGSFVVVQLAFLLLYHTHLTSLQVIGIVMAGGGTTLFAYTGNTANPTSLPPPEVDEAVHC